VEVPFSLALRAAATRGGVGRVRGRGTAFRVWLISGASAPCSVTMDTCTKFLEVVDDASSHEASVDEVRDEESFGVPDDI